MAPAWVQQRTLVASTYWPRELGLLQSPTEASVC
jgi:hypothetical protein